MKRFLFLAALTALSFSAQAQVKISELPAASPLAGSEEIPAVQSGETRKTTPAGIANYVQSVAPDVNLATDVTGTLPVANGGTGATTITGLLRGTGTTPVTGAAVVSLTSEVSGLLPVSNGGTGANTLTGVVKGNGGSAFTAGTVSLTSEITGTLPVANGGTNLTTATDDNIPLGNGTTWQSKAVPACVDSSGNHLNYDASTNTFSCGTTTGAPSGTIGVANGGTGINTAAIDTVIMGTGTTNPMEAVLMPDCTDTGGQHINYNNSTNVFTCGTSVPGGGITETFTDITSTVTPTGFSGAPTKSIQALKTGRTVTLRFSVTGTSNAGTLDMSIPTPFRPAASVEGITRIENNGTSAVGLWTLSTSGAMSVFSSVASAAFTSSGTKSIYLTVSYIGVP